MPTETSTHSLLSLLRDVPDFPKPGIVFKDITPMLANPTAVQAVVSDIVSHFRDQQIGAVAAVEARGFIFGAMIAQGLNVPFVPVRKAGKLPFQPKGCRVLIHDDVLATGGTATAAGNLVKKLNASVAGYSFIINLSFLPGEQVLQEKFGVKPHYLVAV